MRPVLPVFRIQALKTRDDGYSWAPCPGQSAQWCCLLALLWGWLVVCFPAVIMAATLFIQGTESFGKRLVTSVIVAILSGLGNGQLFGVPPYAWLGSAIGYLLGLLSLWCSGDRLRLPRAWTAVWFLRCTRRVRPSGSRQVGGARQKEHSFPPAPGVYNKARCSLGFPRF
jgi:hypothetical protein